MLISLIAVQQLTKTLNKKLYFVNIKNTPQKKPQFRHFEMLIAAFASSFGMLNLKHNKTLSNYKHYCPDGKYSKPQSRFKIHLLPYS